MARAFSVNRPRGTKAASQLKAVGYARRSTDRQEQSIPDQKRAIEQYCQEQGLPLLRVYVDDAISGTSTVGRRAFQEMIADARRPGCGFRLVVVYDVKRFGRIDNDEAGYYRHLLKTHGVEVCYVSENFTGDGTDDLLRPVKQWQAREESKDLAKVVIRGLVSKAMSGGSSHYNGERSLAPGRGPETSSSSSGGGGISRGSGGGTSGGWMGGAPPYGYDLAYESQSGQFLFHLRYLRDGSKQMFDAAWKLIRELERGESISVSRRDRCRLVPGEKTRVDVVKRIFRMSASEGRGLKAIAGVLNRAGVPSPRGAEWARHYSGKWSTSSVRCILTNPAYRGDLVWNRRTDARFFRIVDGRAVERQGVVGRRLEPNDPADWIITRDAHPSLVSRRLWDAAQKRLHPRKGPHPQSDPRKGRGGSTRNGQASDWRGARARFLLSGLCLCSRCGSRYEGYTRYGKQRDAEGRRLKTYHYACGGYIRHGRGTCTLGAIPQDALEQAVIGAVVAFYANFRGEDAEERIMEMLGSQMNGDRRQVDRRRKDLEKGIAKIDATMRKLIDNLTKGNREHVDRRLAELQAERDELERELESLAHSVMSEAEVRAVVLETMQFAGKVETLLTTGPLDQRQGAMRRCVDRAVVDRDNGQVKISFRGLADGLGGAFEQVTVPLAR